MTDTAPVTLGAGLDVELAGLQPPRRRRAVLTGLLRSPVGVIGVTIVLGTVFVALFGSLIWTIKPDAIAAPRLEDPSWAHPMGTDELGRDTLARVIAGARVSLQVGIVAVGVAALLGIPLGLLAAFYGRWVDVIAMRFVDILFALPALVLAIVVAGLLGPSRTNAMLAIGIAYSPAFARVARSSALSVMAQPYIEAARSLGTSSFASIRRHVLPNVTAPLIVMASTYLGTAILSEAALSFLGLGVQPPEPSWGGMLATARTYMLLSPWVAIFPGAAIMLVVLGMNLLGDALRDTLDPRLRRR
jgi:peptide/nickel transport system permease protein